MPPRRHLTKLASLNWPCGPCLCCGGFFWSTSNGINACQLHLIIWLQQHSNFQLQNPPQKHNNKKKNTIQWPKLVYFLKKKKMYLLLKCEIIVGPQFPRCCQSVPVLMPLDALLPVNHDFIQIVTSQNCSQQSWTRLGQWLFQLLPQIRID